MTARRAGATSSKPRRRWAFRDPEQAATGASVVTPGWRSGPAAPKVGRDGTGSDLDNAPDIAKNAMRESCCLGGSLRDAADGTSGALERE